MSNHFAAEVVAVTGRHIIVPGTVNLRDVGGFPAGQNGVSRWAVLYRCDALYGVPDEGIAALAKMNLRSVVDLRTKRESQNAPAPTDTLSRQGIATIWIPLIDEAAADQRMSSADMYQHIVEEKGELIAKVLVSLCHPQALPSLIHCTAGRDRTGIVMAFVLAMLGVRDDVIVADYALSRLYVDQPYLPDQDPAREKVRVRAWLSREMRNDSPWQIKHALDYTRARSGSISGYLMRHGVTEDNIRYLQASLLSLPEEHVRQRGRMRRDGHTKRSLRGT